MGFQVFGGFFGFGDVWDSGVVALAILAVLDPVRAVMSELLHADYTLQSSESYSGA